MIPDSFVDPHVHFWDHSRQDLSWPFLEPGFEHPRLGDMHRLDAPRFTGAELREEAGDVPLEKAVHIQCAREDRPGAEVAWLQELSDGTGWPHAIVTRCRLAGSGAAAVLGRHASFPGFRGVRDTEAGTDLASDAFLRGWEHLAGLGGSLEVMVSYEQFADVVATARHRPEATVVLGHAGLPVRRDEAYFSAWAAALEDVARQPNVVCKISALASGADPHWSVESIRPWVRTCIETFGAARCMFATNWPIDRLFGSYPALVGAYAAITDDVDAAERADLFAKTAERVYRI